MVIVATILFNILMATISSIDLCLNKPERQVICSGLKLTLLCKINEPLTVNHLPLQAVVLTAPIREHSVSTHAVPRHIRLSHYLDIGRKSDTLVLSCKLCRLAEHR